VGKGFSAGEQSPSPEFLGGEHRSALKGNGKWVDLDRELSNSRLQDKNRTKIWTGGALAEKKRRRSIVSKKEGVMGYKREKMGEAFLPDQQLIHTKKRGRGTF